MGTPGRPTAAAGVSQTSVRQRWRAQRPAAGWAVAEGVRVVPVPVLLLVLALVLVLVFVLVFVLLLLFLVLVVVVMVVVAVLAAVLGRQGGALFGKGGDRRGGHRQHGLFHRRGLFAWEREVGEHVQSKARVVCFHRDGRSFTWCGGPLQQVEVMVDEGLAVVNSVHVDVFILHRVELRRTQKQSR